MRARPARWSSSSRAAPARVGIGGTRPLHLAEGREAGDRRHRRDGRRALVGHDLEPGTARDRGREAGRRQLPTSPGRRRAREAQTPPDGQANRPQPRRRPGAVPALSRGPCTHVTIGSILPPVTRFQGSFPAIGPLPAMWPTPEAATPRDLRQSAKWLLDLVPSACPLRRPSQPSGERAHGDAFAKPENFPESPVRMARRSALAPAGCGTSVPGEVHQTPRGATQVHVLPLGAAALCRARAAIGVRTCLDWA